MLRLRNRSGGGDWEFFVPQTGHVIKGRHFDQLQHRVRDHLVANGYADVPVEDSILEDYNARKFQKIDPECCYDTGQEPLTDRKLTPMDVVRFTKTLFLHALNKFQLVDQEEAERRAKICSQCHLNRLIHNCNACSNSGLAASTVGKLIGDRQTSLDSVLHSCLHCGCFLKVKVWFPKEVQVATPPDGFEKQPPKECWAL